MNILIVTHVFSPLNVIGAQRTYSWAKYWSKLGHKVCVLTTQKEAFDGPVDTEFDFRDIQSVRIEEVKYWPFSASRNVVENSNFNHPSNSNFLISKARPISKMIRQGLGMGAVLSVRNLWIRPAIRRAISLHAQYSFDCIVSSYGPPAPHLVASQLQKKIQIPWIADYRDLWHGTHYQDAEGLFSFFQKTIEDRAISRAKLLTTVSEPLRDQLEVRFKKETLTIENGFDIEEINGRTEFNFPEKNNKLSLVYTGTVRTGKQCVLPLFQAIKKIQLKYTNLDHDLEVLFYGRELGEIPALINEYGVDKICKMPGFLNRKNVLKAQSEANALLFFDWKDTRVDGILSGKIFEYLYSGTPILGIGSYHQLAPGRLLQESGCGLCLEQSPELIESVLMRMISGEAIPYSPKLEILAKYSRKKLAEKMIGRISEIVKS